MYKPNSHSTEEKYKIEVLRKGILPLSLSIIVLSIIFVIGYIHANSMGKTIVLIINLLSILFLLYFLFVSIKDYVNVKGFVLSKEGILLPKFKYYKNINKYKIKWNEIMCIYTNPNKDFISIILKDHSKIDIFKDDVDDLKGAITFCRKYVKVKDSDCGFFKGCEC